MSSTAVEALDVERRYGRRLAVRGVSLRVPAGASLAIFGPNGAGKTTLLRVIAQVLRPSAGRVAIFGVDARDRPADALRQLGFVGHELGLYLDLTARENLAFSGRLYGIGRLHERVDEVLASVAMADRAEQQVRAMSRGLQQRLALARALLHEPPLLLLDEPWTGLDPRAQQVLKRRLDAHRAAGGTAIYATHDVALGLASADRVVLLKEGRLELESSREELDEAVLGRAFEAPELATS